MNIQRLLLLRVNSGIDVAPPPLGLMYVASYIRDRRRDIDIKILDGRCKGLSMEQINSIISDYRPDILGITSMHVEAENVHAQAKSAKRILPQIKIIIGGPYACADYQKALEDSAIDFAVVGEGEEVMDELIGAFDENQQISGIKGLAHKKDGKVIFNGPRDFIKDLDSLPLPAWDLINLDDYFYGKKRPLENPLQVHKKAVAVFSSRGCPYQCTYCHNIFGKRFRARSAENVVAEIELLKNKYGIKEIEFLDDSFNIDKARAHRIFDLIIHKKLDIKICFSNGIRIDRIDEELLDKMRRSGVYRVNYGIESASKRIQAVMKKNLNIEIANNVINKTIKKGILSGGFFMMGFPTETEQEVMETIGFAARSKLHTAVFAIVTPFPSTEMYADAVSAGNIPSGDFSTVQKVTINLSNVPYRRLEELRFYAYRRFYMNPARALRIFFAAPSKIPVFKNFIEVVRVAFFKKVLYGS